MSTLLRRALMIGLFGGVAGVHVSLVGIVNTFQTRDLIADIVTIGSVLPMLIAIMVGWLAGSTPQAHSQAIRIGDARPRGAGRRRGRRRARRAGIARRFRQPDLDPGQRPSAARQHPLLRAGTRTRLGHPHRRRRCCWERPGLASISCRERSHALLAISGIVTIIAALMEPFIGAVLRNVELRAIEALPVRERWAHRAGLHSRLRC